MAQAATSDETGPSANDHHEETPIDAMAPPAASDPVSEEVPLSPIHKRPRDDTSTYVRSQGASTDSADGPPSESNSDGSAPDDEKNADNALPSHALAKLVETHSLKAVEFPVVVFVRIRPMVGKEVEDQHSSIKYAVKTMKKTKTQKLTIKKVSAVAPETKDDDDGDDGNAVEMDDAQKKMLAIKQRLGQRGRDIDYKGFRKILLPGSDNEAVFGEAVAPFVSNVMLGQKTCIFSYGHTGSGKTHTIFGYQPDHPGMFELFAKKLLSELADVKGVGVQIRFTELYNRRVFDLLSDDNRRCYLRESDGEFRLRADPVKGDDGLFRAYPVTGVIVRDIESLRKVIANGVASRKCGRSTLHDKSSRSHAFLEFEVVSKKLVKLRKEIVEFEAEYLEKQNNMKKYGHVTQRELKKMEAKLKRMQSKEAKLCNDKKRPYVGGVINFVDLAGNEYGRDAVGTAEDEGQQRERNEINQSLMALKECIRALNGKKKFVGFRSSELTKYLRKYLKGKDAHAVMLAHIGPSRQFEKQSKNTLQYSELVAKAAV